MGHPQTLRVSLETDIHEAEPEQGCCCHSEDEYNNSVPVVKPGQLFKYCLEVHVDLVNNIIYLLLIARGL
jgi:hypothetical protein